MTHNKLLTGLFLSTGLLLSACNLTVAQTVPMTENSIETTPITTAATVPDEVSASYVLNQSANAMLKVQSYEYISTTVSKFGTSEVTSTTKATIFPIQGDGWNETIQNNTKNTTYLKANVMYMVDPRTQSWVFVEMPKSTGFTQITVNPKVNDYMTLQKTDSGYLLKSIRPLSALEFYMLSGIEGKEMQNLADMVDQGIALDTVVEIELDAEYRYKQVIYDQVTTTGGVSTQSYLKYEYSNYNSADPIVVPEDILKSAVKLNTGMDGSTQSGSAQPSTVPDETTSGETIPVETIPGETTPGETTPPETTPSPQTMPLETAPPNQTMPLETTGPAASTSTGSAPVDQTTPPIVSTTP